MSSFVKGSGFTKLSIYRERKWLASGSHPGGQVLDRARSATQRTHERNRTVANLPAARRKRVTGNTRNLPLRWVVILAVAAGAGIAVGCLTTVPAGLAAGVGLAAFLHKATD